MDQEQLLRHVVDVLERMEVTYMVVGSYASGAYGEPRFTQDIDIVVRLEQEDVSVLHRAFPDEEYYFTPESARDALTQGGQFNIIHLGTGNKVDFMIARRDQWGREQLQHRRRMQILPGLEASVARPEDIIISKMLYYKESKHERHLRDCAGMLRVSGDLIDRAYIQRWAEHFDLTEIWRAIVECADG